MHDMDAETTTALWGCAAHWDGSLVARFAYIVRAPSVDDEPGARSAL